MRLKKRNKRKKKQFSSILPLAAFITLLFFILVGTPGCLLQTHGTADPFEGEYDEEISPPPDGCVGEYYSYDLHSAINFSNIPLPVTFEITGHGIMGGDIQDELTLDEATGILSGVPTTEDEYNFEFTAWNSSDVNPEGNVTIRIKNFSITTDFLPPACSGEAYSAVITICGGSGSFLYEIEHPRPTFPVFGEADETSSRHNTLIGIPPTADTYSFILRVTDSDGEYDRKPFTITVSDDTRIISPQGLPMAVEGETYESYTLQACGGSLPYNWTCSSDDLPVGMNLSEAGVLWGEPGDGTGGAYRIWIHLRDSDDSEDQGIIKSFYLTVAGSRLTVSPITPPSLTECDPITSSPIARASGGMGEKHWVVNLPTGMEGSARFTPTTAGDVLNMSWLPHIAGLYTFDVQVRDATPRAVETPVIFRVNEIEESGIEIVRVYHMEGTVGDPDNEIYLDENNDDVVDFSDHRFKIRFRVTDGACATAVDGDDIFSASTTSLKIIGFCDLSIPSYRIVFEPDSGLYVAVFDIPGFNGMIDDTGGITGESRTLRLRIEVDCSASNIDGSPIRYIGNTVEVRVFRERPSRP
jgi:hypothetical protein